MEKIKMYYSRTYRHLKPNYKEIAFFYILFSLPCFIFMLYSYSAITNFLANCTHRIISDLMPDIVLNIENSKFIPFLGDVYYISLPNTMPSNTMIIVNLVIISILFLICLNVKDSGKPLAIYLNIALSIHLVSCIYFLFLPNLFPYNLSQYSEFYIKQQVGIWLCFFVIANLVSGVISNSGISKFITVVGITVYSFVFGCLRYIVYLVLMLKASILYMPVLFFVFGTFFDFIYLVYIYGRYMKYLTSKFDSKGSEDWEWA